jgi:hypothetical protein
MWTPASDKGQPSPPPFRYARGGSATVPGGSARSATAYSDRKGCLSQARGEREGCVIWA